MMTEYTTNMRNGTLYPIGDEKGNPVFFFSPDPKILIC
jgi:hypothetical protein